MMLLTQGVWVVMYARRIPFILRAKLSPGQLTPAELARLSPPAVANPSDNPKNLFEIPTLLYAFCRYLFVIVVWPEELPFHEPVYVLTNRKRDPWVRPGGATFHFINERLERALELARQSAGAGVVRPSRYLT